MVHSRNRARNVPASRVSWSDYDSWRSENHTFEQLGIWLPGFVQLTGSEADVERVESAAVSGNAFDLLGVKTLFGRSFSQADEQSRRPVAVLSYGLWQRRYGGDRVRRKNPASGSQPGSVDSR